MFEISATHAPTAAQEVEYVTKTSIRTLATGLNEFWELFDLLVQLVKVSEIWLIIEQSRRFHKSAVYTCYICIGFLS